jgi:hypothetical protein
MITCHNISLVPDGERPIFLLEVSWCGGCADNGKNVVIEWDFVCASGHLCSCSLSALNIYNLRALSYDLLSYPTKWG